MYKNLIGRIGIVLACFGISTGAHAAFHLWQITELYSNADGSVQFIKLTALAGGQQFVNGHTITSSNGGTPNSFTFPANLPGDTTGKTFVLGTAGFAALGVVTPDYTIPSNFLFPGGGTVTFAEGADSFAHAALPAGGKLSLLRAGGTALNAPKNFANATGSIRVPQTRDFNRDMKSDILWANTVTGGVFQMQMNGFAINSGTQFYTEPDLTWKIVGTGDFNGDGKADILWHNSATGAVYVMTMNGNAIASGQVVYTEPDLNWKILYTGDFNGDGKADIVWRHQVSGAVFVMIMNGFNVVSGGVIYTEPDLNWKIVGTGDTDGDGRDDIIWRHQVGGGGEVFVMRMNGAVIQAGQYVYTEPSPDWQIVKTGDLNGDGKTDLVWRNTVTGDVFAQLLNGFTVTGGGVFYNESPVWQIEAVGDHNGDGRADVLWRNTNNGQVFLMLMNGTVIQAGQFIYTEPDTNWKILGF